MAVSLDEAAMARCLAAFIERDQLRERVALLEREIPELRSETERLRALVDANASGGDGNV